MKENSHTKCKNGSQLSHGKELCLFANSASIMCTGHRHIVKLKGEERWADLPVRMGWAIGLEN